MALQIPTVRVDDLRQFHAKHFPQAPPPEQFVSGADVGGGAVVDEEHHDYGDDGLGYYDDGVKRTLTDEQIAMFRHSEIQIIIRERRRKREASRSPSPEPESTPMELAESSSQAPTRFECETPDSPRPNPAEVNQGADRVQHGRVEKPQQQWTKLGPKSKARNAKNRKKNRVNHRARKKEEKKKKREPQRDEEGSDEESDEWDAWHQANGPDAQKDTAVDLDY
ncbi:hypothetical protein BDV95DRAFT_603787 [Massariosphaeria phaeospora]|uniref:Uncharacterized protein n=1 Tax=Massariosphaeria phaeospora TaxID=100035 RepID=A0A7C8IAW3_9PLEO|nr:hypothetical protein BDV95DRAFT_603787 [Massariosphaeria phaeospora]